MLAAMTIAPSKGIVHSNPEIICNTPVFVGMRVSLQKLIDYLDGSESIHDDDGGDNAKPETRIMRRLRSARK